MSVKMTEAAGHSRRPQSLLFLSWGERAGMLIDQMLKISHRQRLGEEVALDHTAA